MKTYLTYKTQMRGLEDVSETVKTVEKVAASSVHFLKQEVSRLNAYAAEVERVLARLSLFYQKENHPLLQKRETGREMLVVLTGNRGLVGGLWHKIIRASLENIKRRRAVAVVGAKGEKHLKEENITAVALEIGRAADYVFGEFKKGTLSRVAVLYPQFVSLAQQRPALVPFLPFEFKLAKEKKSGEGWPIFEPSQRKIFDSLLEKYIGVFFHKIVMETKLSELSARTVAMEQAAAKTNRLTQKLTLEYAKERRRIATQRQLASFTTHKMI